MQVPWIIPQPRPTADCVALPEHAPPMVVKIGGSLAGSPDLKSWLAALDKCAQPLVVVPGGGAFSDTVRSMQAAIGFDDETAHRMALVSMQQYGTALAALWPRLVVATTPAALRRALRMGQVPCWHPAGMAIAAALPKSWDLTSDSLAAWLAGKLKAEKLLLIKSVDCPAAGTAADLAVAGIVDSLFPHYAAESGATVAMAGPASLAGSEALLAQGALPGHKICFR